MRPSGSPSTIASDVPSASSPIACEPLFIGATLTASDAVIDQNIACEAAIPIRASTSTQKSHATAAKTWQVTKSKNTFKSSLLRSNFAVISMKGSDKIVTIHA